MQAVNVSDNPADEPTGAPGEITHMDDVPHISRWSYPWLLLVAPVRTWQLNGLPTILGGLLASWLCWGAGWLLASRWYFELSRTAGLTNSDAPFNYIQPFLEALLMLPTLALGILALSVLLMLAWRLIGLATTIKQTYTWLLNGNIPFAVGILLAWVIFAFVQPEHASPELAIAMELRPFSLGLASLLPASFPALSLQWFIASYCDVFALWTAGVLYFGAAHYLGFGRLKACWAMLALMLLWVGLLTGLWIVIHKFISF